MLIDRFLSFSRPQLLFSAVKMDVPLDTLFCTVFMKGRVEPCGIVIITLSFCKFDFILFERES